MLAAALELSPAQAQEAAPLRGGDAASENAADALPDLGTLDFVLLRHARSTRAPVVRPTERIRALGTCGGT